MEKQTPKVCDLLPAPNLQLLSPLPHLFEESERSHVKTRNKEDFKWPPLSFQEVMIVTSKLKPKHAATEQSGSFQFSLIPKKIKQKYIQNCSTVGFFCSIFVQMVNDHS